MDLSNEVLRAINGDAGAMEVLYNETYPKLRAVTFSILKNEDDAEDIIQETYIKAFSGLQQLDDPGKFEGWLCRIASNKCKDYLKKHKPVLFTDLNSSNDEDDAPYEWSIEDENPDYNPEEVAINDDTRRQLMELVNSLPDEQRICLVYYAVEEMKISEIAQLLEVPEATVKSRLKYAKDKMRNKIEELEKKGVKIRSVSGFALIPFLHYLFATEAKAAAVSFTSISEAVAAAAKASSSASSATATASTVSKTAVTEVAKQAGTKVAVGLGAKIASMPLAVKIAAGVVALAVTIGVPVALYNAVSSSENNFEDTYTEHLQNENSNDCKETELDNITENQFVKEIEQAIEARYKVVITVLGIDNWRNRTDIKKVIEDNQELILQVVPLEVWQKLGGSQDSIVDIVKGVIYTHYDYVMPGYNYNAGLGFDIDYSIVDSIRMNSDELSVFCDKIYENKDNENVLRHSIYDEVPLNAGEFIKEGTITDGYKVTVKYVLSGTNDTIISEKTYNVIKSGDNWYSLDGISFGLWWDLPFDDQLSKAWQPGYN